MKANSIRMENFRGGSLELPLTGLDIVTAPNGFGKTRILQAVQMVLSGNVPNPQDEKNINILNLFTNELGKTVMRIGLSFEDDLKSFDRIYSLEEKKGELKVSSEFDFRDMVERKPKEAERFIAETFGSFPVMIDLHRFIRMSDEQRSGLMMSIGDFSREKWSEANIREMLFSMCYEKKLNRDLLSDPFEKFAGKMRLNIQDGLVELQEYFKKKESELHNTIKVMSQTAVGSVTLNAMEDKTKSLRPMATIKGELDKAREDYKKDFEDLTRAKSSLDEFKRMQQEKKQIEEKIAPIKKLASLEKIAGVEKDIVVLQALVVPVPEEWEQQEKGVISKIGEEKELLESYRSQLSKAKTSLELLIKQSEALAGGKCPTCGQDAHEVSESIHGLSEMAEESVKDRELEFNASLDAISALEKELSEIQTKNAEHIRRVQQAWADIHHKEFEVKDMKSKLDSVSTLEKRLSEINAYKNENPVNIEQSELALQGLVQKGEALQSEHTERVKYDQGLATAKEASTRMKKAEEDLDTIKEIREKLRLIRWDIVKDILNPISEKAVQIFHYNGHAFGKEISFKFQFEDARGNEVFKFGWNIQNDQGERFIDFDSLSTAQQLFTLIAVISPIIELGNPKLKFLMLDNCEVISSEFREPFLKILGIAQEVCHLDNILIASSGNFPIIDTAYGVNYIDLESIVG